MATALAVYCSAAASTTLTTANKLYANSAGSPTNTATYSNFGTGTGYIEIASQGQVGTCAGSIGNPSGLGFLYDVTSLEGKQFIAGSWSANIRLNASQFVQANGTGLTQAGTLTADLYVRVYIRSSSGTYTQICQMVNSSQSITSTFTTYGTGGSTPNSGSFTTTTSVASPVFQTGDKLYIDVWANITANANGNANQGIRLNRLSTDTTNFVGDASTSVTSPGYATAVLKDLSARFRQQATQTKDLLVRFRQQATSLNDIKSRFILAVPQRNLDLSARLRQLALTSRDLSTRFRLQVTRLRDISVRFPLLAIPTLDLLTRFRLLATRVRDLSTRMRLSVLVNRDLSARMRQQATRNRDLVGRFLLSLASQTRDLSTRFRQLATSVRDLASRVALKTPGTPVVLSVPTTGHIGLNYYHESMGYIGRTTGQITQDLQTIQTVTNKLKVYFNPLPQNSGAVSRSTALANVQNIISIAKSLGMYVIWIENIDQGQVLTDSTTNLSNPASYKWKWSDYSAQVVTDAGLAQTAGADEFLVGNEIRGSSHYYATDPGTSSATTIYTSGAFPGNVSTLVASCKAVFSGKVGYQEVNTVSSEWASFGFGNLDKLYFDLYEKWATFQSKATSLVNTFGTTSMEFGEVSSLDAWGNLGFYNAYTEGDWARELMRRYDYCRQLGVTMWCFTYGDPSPSSTGFGLRTNAAGNQTFHDIWLYLQGKRQLTYQRQFLDTFPPNDFSGGTVSSNELQVSNSNTSALASSGGSPDYVYRGQLRFFASSGVVRVVTRYTDANNYYCLNVDVTNNQVTCIRRQGGTETQLGTTVPWPPHGSFSNALSSSSFTTFDFELRVSGSGASTQIAAFFDTYKVCDVIDTGNTSLAAPTLGLLYVSVGAGIANVVVQSQEQFIVTGTDIATRFRLQFPGTLRLSDIPFRLRLQGTTPFNVYFASTVSSTLSSGNKLYTTSGATATIAKYSRVGTATGYGEIVSQGTTSAWAALGSIGAPTGKGFFLDGGGLANKLLLGGSGWSATLRLNCAQGGDSAPQAGSLTADLFVRVFKYMSGTYSLITTMSLTGQSLTFSFANYTFTGSSLVPTTAFTEAGATLYVDVWANVTGNANGSSVQDIRFNRLSSDLSARGDTAAQVVTNGYLPLGVRNLAARLVLQLPPPVPPLIGAEIYRGFPTCLPIPVPTTPYLFAGVTLDTPVLCTAPPLSGGQLLAGSSFTLLFQSPSTTTQNALTLGATGSMQLTLADGAKITAPAQVQTTLLTGSLLQVTFTVTQTTPIWQYVTITQFF